MTTINRKRLEYACERFLTEMNRAYVKTHPGEDSVVRKLSDYSPEQRSMLMRAVGTAIKATQPAEESSYQTWMERQLETQDE